MKPRNIILTSIICIASTGYVFASDCGGGECIFDDMYATNVMATESASQPTLIAPQPTQYAVYSEPMYSAKLLSIKPVPADSRPPLWDGTGGQYVRHTSDKTVDWRDGVPIWDDSIANYRDKDFSDWFLEPLPELYLRTVDVPTQPMDTMALYTQTMADAAATRARVEELLAPQRPTTNLWLDSASVATTCDTAIHAAPTCAPAQIPEKYAAQDMSTAIAVAFGNDGCPFESETECQIWRRKPIVREVVAPRSNRIRTDLMSTFVDAARCDANINATAPAAAPLVARYKMLMQSANACCTDGMVHALRNAGASDGLVYKFMADDANFYGFGSRCLMMTDTELDEKYPNTATASVAADVRNGCLCRGRQWFEAMLAPFAEAYAAAPEFASSMFYYTYTDGLGRNVTVSINNDVQNVMRQLAQCP